MNTLLLFAASVLAGLAVAVGAWAMRGWLMVRYERDCQWMRDTYLRFYPDPINAQHYTIGYYVAFVVLLFLLLAVIPVKLIAVLIWVLSWFFPRALVGWAWKRRLAKIDTQIPQTVSTLANSMRAGLTLVQAITRLSEQAPDPIRSEFKIMANQYGYGADMETVIRNAKARLDLPNFTLFASALLLNREMGGDISETLTRISKSLDKLREMKKTVEAHTSEGRTNIKVLLAAPVFMLGMMSIVMPKGVAMLFTTLPGAAMLMISLILAGAGVYMANRITRTEIQHAMAETVLKILAAGLFGAAVALMAFAAWALLQKRRQVRAGGPQTSMRRADMRQQALAASPAFRFFLPFITGLAPAIQQLGLEPLRQYIHAPYVRAGYPGGLDDEEVVSAGVLMAAICTLLIGFITVAFFGLAFAWIALIGLPLGFFALVAHLQTRGEEREIEILRALPYALDLLVLMLRSGTSMRIALARVIDDYHRHPLGVEFGQVLAEIDVGSARADAFKKMAERLRIADITSLVDAIVQSEELGWPLADTLERLADRINSERVLRAQATAGAAGVYVMLPSTLVLMSAILLLFAPFIVMYLVTGSIVGT